jgi:hypothetical protein
MEQSSDAFAGNDSIVESISARQGGWAWRSCLMARATSEGGTTGRKKEPTEAGSKVASAITRLTRKPAPGNHLILSGLSGGPDRDRTDDLFHAME